MTAAIVATQIVVPLALLLWLALGPAGSLVGVIVQAAGVGAILLGLAFIAQWAVPVWWLPQVYGVLWLLAALRSLRAKRSVLPATGWGWAAAMLSTALLFVGGYYSLRAVAGRALPPVAVVDIAHPFGPGSYLVGHGGSLVLVNGHMRTLDETVERFRPWRGQSYAVDFFGLGPWGLRAEGWRPSDPAAYAIFGAALVAPCDGEVVATEGAMPDLEVPKEDVVNRLGNHVILRCGEVEIVLAHMRQGSIAVGPGDILAVGDPLGQVGNSGASTEPHLHIHAQRPAANGEPPISGDPLALRIDGRFLVRGDHLKGRGN